MTTDKADLAISHANAVFARMDERDGAVRSAAQRERARLNAGLGRTLKRTAIAIGVISIATIGIGRLRLS